MGAPFFIRRSPVYYGWLLVPIAAFCMLGTLPGRTFGLSLLTESLLGEFDLSRTRFAFYNLVTALIGATFCLGVGWAVDRLGIRLVLSLVLALLGLATWWFAQAESLLVLVLCLLLARGLGQSSLSLGSLALIGKWFVGRLGAAMGIFSVLVSLLFAAAIPFLQHQVGEVGWRPVWGVLGVVIALGAVPVLILVRNRPEDCDLPPDPEQKKGYGQDAEPHSFTLSEAMQTSLYWVFTLGSALFNLVIAGVFLFNQSIIKDLGFSADLYQAVMGTMMLTGMIGSLLSGWLVRHVPMGRVMSVALVVTALCLLVFPFLQSSSQIVLHAVPLGAAGGVIPVIFFTCYGRAFGREHLGAIQGSAQVAAVFASASGPLLFAWFRDVQGSYWPPMLGCGVVLVVLGGLSWSVRRPEGPPEPVIPAEVVTS